MADAHSDSLRHALEIARQRGYAEVEVSLGSLEFQAVLEPRATKPRPQATSGVAQVEEGPELSKITAPVVGYFREGKVVLAPGAAIKKGDIVAIIEALGLANEVEATESGEVQEVLVSAGDAVDFGKVLATLKAGE